ncbi:UNVERIFIED_ORG: hypothetical protein DFS12_1011540 [Chitinophaga ginsengisegetis]
MRFLIGWRTTLFLCSMLVLFSCRKGKEIEPQIASPEARRIITKNLSGVKGTYAFPPLINRKKIDCDKLISELKDLHANCYNWLVLTGHDEWEDLPVFLPKARAAGIKVWVTVLPPSETYIPNYCSEPYRNDYFKWAEELAKLSLVYDNLVAWSIDDFPVEKNMKLFTRPYIREMRQKMNAINPNFGFIPCIYYRDFTPQFAREYGGFFDGVLFPYYAASRGKGNFTDYNTLTNELKVFKACFGKNIPIIVDVYAGEVSFLQGIASPSYIYNLIKLANANADGATIYCHRDAVRNPENIESVKSGFAE